MKKIPTLFKRGPDFKVIPEIREGCEWVHEGKGLITVKIDGMCVKVEKDDKGVYKLRRRLKPSTEIYTEASFVPCNREDPNDQHLYACYDAYGTPLEGIYEAFGPNIQGNPQGSAKNGLIKIVPVDGALIVHTSKIRRGPAYSVEEFYNSIKAELSESPIEGLVFVLEEPSMTPVAWAKIKRKDFGFEWPLKGVTNA